MVARLLYRAGLRDTPMHAGALGSIALCLSLWVRAKTVDQDERGNAERRAIFVGLWPPMFWLIGDALRREAHRSHRSWRPLR
jgi:hypothetical protein